MLGIDLISDILFHWESSLQAVMFILPPPQILFTYTCFLSGISGMTWDCTEVLRGLFSSSLLSF